MSNTEYHYEPIKGRNLMRDGKGRMKNKPKRKRRGKKGFRMMGFNKNSKRQWRRKQR